MTKYVLMGIMTAGLLVFGADRALAGCGKCEGDAHGDKAKTEQALCGKCGQVKGDDACCKKGAEICGACKLHKGSPGCAKACAAKPVEGDGHKHAEGEKAH